jgi:hypothetical protein
LKNKNCTKAIKKGKCGLAFLPFELAYSKICSTIQPRTAILALSILWKNKTLVKMLYQLLVGGFFYFLRDLPFVTQFLVDHLVHLKFVAGS